MKNQIIKKDSQKNINIEEKIDKTRKKKPIKLKISNMAEIGKKL